MADLFGRQEANIPDIAAQNYLQEVAQNNCGTKDALATLAHADFQPAGGKSNS